MIQMCSLETKFPSKGTCFPTLVVPAFHQLRSLWDGGELHTGSVSYKCHFPSFPCLIISAENWALVIKKEDSDISPALRHCD